MTGALRGALAVYLLLTALAAAGCAVAPEQATRAPTPGATTSDSTPVSPSARVYETFPTANRSGQPSPADSEVVALNAASGAVIWRHDAATFLFQPVATAGAVYATSYVDDPQRASLTEALDPQSGKLAWTHKTPGTLMNPPVVAGGVVYLSSYQPGNGDESVGLVEALDAPTGALRWQQSLTERPSPALVDGATVYVTGMGGYFGTSATLALDATTGKPRWTYTSHAELGTLDERAESSDALLPPMLAGGALIDISTIRDSHGYAIQSALALDVTSGKPLWSYSTGGIVKAPVIAGAVMYLSADVVEGNTTHSHLLALRLRDGALLWNRDAGAEQLVSSVTIANSQSASSPVLVIVSSVTNGQTVARLLGLAQDDGRILWTTSLGQGGAGVPTFAGGLALIQVATPPDKAPGVMRIVAIQPTDGRIAWRQVIGNWPEFVPIFAFAVQDAYFTTVTDYNSSGLPQTVSALALRVSDGGRLWKERPVEGA
jgi:outer membrane protein assembly factor BamB